MRIALIFNDPIATKVLSEVLASEGHQVEGFLDGKSALSHVVAGLFDVIVCGTLLPDLRISELLAAYPRAATRFIFIDNTGGDPLATALLAGLRVVSLPIWLQDVLGHIDQIDALC